MRLTGIELGIVCKSERERYWGEVGTVHLSGQGNRLKCGDCGAVLCWWTIADGWWTRLVFSIKIRRRTALCKGWPGCGQLFLLPTSTEVAFNTTNSPRFYSSAIHLSANQSSPLRTTRCGILLNHRTTAF